MEEKKKKRVNVRDKGHKAEREYARIFREDLGFTFCKTSRQANRMLDDAGVDLAFLPFNVQIKAGYAKGLNEFNTLNIIRERLPNYFPPFDTVHEQPDILIHKRDTGRGNKKKDTDELVFMWRDDFCRFFGGRPLIEQAKLPLKEGQKRGWTYEDFLIKKDFMLYKNKEQTLIVFTFEKFKELIKKKYDI